MVLAPEAQIVPDRLAASSDKLDMTVHFRSQNLTGVLEWPHDGHDCTMLGRGLARCVPECRVVLPICDDQAGGVWRASKTRQV